ncbi:MAG: nucleotide exchange factor GrpE [Candidatus Omnitrophica bacterium]|nr:nucleotide exchange factor GrpE [Candidatus Omnitrophota bacterium]
MKHKKEPGKEQGDEMVEVPRGELDQLLEKAKERDIFEAKWLKVHAEYENTRKRLEKEKTNFVKFANEGIVSQLFPIVDNFDMALDAMEKAKDKTAVMDGIRLVQKEFHRILEENGVERIQTKGKKFDPNVHEAVATAETDDYPEDEIIDEVRAGYLLNGRLLRPAQVIVVKNTG